MYLLECTRNITGYRGVIESPNFPQPYDSLLNCTWTITAPHGNKINLTFSHFDLETKTFKECIKDYLLIEEGENDSPETQLGKYCGPKDDFLSMKIYSEMHQVFLTFITDRNKNFGGFRLEWYVNGCTEKIIKPKGIIKSPSMMRSDGTRYEDLVECKWLIEVDFEKSIEITFDHIDTTKSHTCSDCKRNLIT